ncbi:MAG: hypothetical protein Q4D38_03285 [Planctomycetia bacterium]|nr:hypothetical protein [Planctomycetia bacterium]
MSNGVVIKDNGDQKLNLTKDGPSSNASYFGFGRGAAHTYAGYTQINSGQFIVGVAGLATCDFRVAGGASLHIYSSSFKIPVLRDACEPWCVAPTADGTGNFNAKYYKFHTEQSDLYHCVWRRADDHDRVGRSGVWLPILRRGRDCWQHDLCKWGVAHPRRERGCDWTHGFFRRHTVAAGR